MRPLQKRLERFVTWCGDAPEYRRLAEEAMTVPASRRRVWLAGKANGSDLLTVNAILDHARDRLDDQPEEAVAAAELAISLIYGPSNVFRVGVEREEVEGRAWLEHGNALRQRGLLYGALYSIEQSCRLFATNRVSQVSLADAKCSEAFVRHLLGDSEVALALLGAAGRAFVIHGETAGEGRCHVVEGIVHFDNGRYESATSSFDGALVLASAGGDEPTSAASLLNLGHCAVARRDRASATRYYARALTLYDRHGATIGRKRVAWGMARLLIDEAKYDAGIRGLELVVQDMAAAGLVIDAAVARAEVLEALVRAGRPSEAAAAATPVLEAFTTLGMIRGAMRILAMIRDPEIFGEDFESVRAALGSRKSDA
jgi:tetratricopeptide (TPR) repeat protein